MEDIKITLETLYDILRNEKKREDLQRLENTFYIDVVSYLREKKSILESKRHDNDIFAAGEKEKLEYELRSIKRILKEIYEKREKKIIDIALNRSRTGSDIIDTSAMLIEEREFYLSVLRTLDAHRSGVLMNLFKAEMPSLSQIVIQQKLVQEQHETHSTEENKDITPNKDLSTLQNMIRIRIIHAIPSFIWKDLKEYGPFDKGEETEIFPEIAELLVRKGRAENVSENLTRDS